MEFLFCIPLPLAWNLLSALIESHANQIRKLNQRRKPNEGGNFKLLLLFSKEVPHISDRNEIRKIMIYGIGEYCTHTHTHKVELKLFLFWLLRRVCSVVLSGITILINKFSAQTGGHGIILKLLWCLALFWFCFYTSNDLWNRHKKSMDKVFEEWGVRRKVCKCRRKLMSKWIFNEITIDNWLVLRLRVHGKCFIGF